MILGKKAAREGIKQVEQMRRAAQTQRTWRDSWKARAKPLFFAAYFADFGANFKDSVKFAVGDAAFHKFCHLSS